MIPYNTDAPLYHPPIATIGLIALNVVLFFVIPGRLSSLYWADESQVQDAEFLDPIGPLENDPDDPFLIDPDAAGAADPLLIDAVDLQFRSKRTLRLQLGNGIRPHQWFSSPFVHGDFFQLIFNMVALWAFGLVIEGKLGWWKFLLLYAGIGISQAAVVQTLMAITSVDTSIAGSGASLLGLLGLAIVWAPKNSFDVWFGPWFGSFEVSILIYGFVEFAFGLIALTFGSAEIDGGYFQILGLFVGLGLGFLWLQRGWVDCEQWDIISVFRGDNTRTEDQNEELDAEARQLLKSSLKSGGVGHSHLKPDRPATSPSRSKSRGLRHAPKQPTAGPAAKPTRPQGTTAPPSTGASADPAAEQQPPPVPTVEEDLSQLIAAGNYPTAIKLLSRLQGAGKPHQLSQPELAKLIRDLLADKQYATALPFMTEHIERFADNRTSLQLNSSKLLLHLERPKRAMALLKGMNRQQLSARELTTWRTLHAHAAQQIEAGVIEFSD